MGIFIIVGSFELEWCYGYFSTTIIIPWIYFILKDKASSKADRKLTATVSSLPPQEESSKPKSHKEGDPDPKEKVNKASLHNFITSMTHLTRLPWCLEFLNIISLSVVHEETSYARASNRGGQACNKALLSEEGHHKGRVQRDFA